MVAFCVKLIVITGVILLGYLYRYCKNPPDMEEFWPDDITQWPVSTIALWLLIKIIITRAISSAP